MPTTAIMRSRLHAPARTAGGRRLRDIDQTPAVELHRERMAINTRAQRIICSRHRRNGENYKNSISRLQHWVASFNQRATLMRQTTESKPATTAAEPRPQPAPRPDNTTDNCEQNTSEWPQGLTKAISALFDEYNRNKPNPETKDIPASGSSGKPLTGVIETRPEPTNGFHVSKVRVGVYFERWCGRVPRRVS